MSIQTGKRIVGVAALGFVATAGATVIVPHIAIAAQDRSPWFWGRIGWTIFLAALVWTAIGGFFGAAFDRAKAKGGWMGVLPGATVFISLFAFLSFGIMLAAAFLEDVPVVGTVHLVAQVVMTLCLVVVLVLSTLAPLAQVAGAERIPNDLPTPEIMAAKLKGIEERLLGSERADWGENGGHQKMADALKALREKLRYSLPSAGAIGRSRSYADFCDGVEGLCSRMCDPKGVTPPSTEGLVLEIREMVMKVDQVAADLRR